MNLTDNIESYQQVYRTTPARTGKMMAIMLGICIVGGAIFFAMWDYWISEPAPVVAMMASSGDGGSADAAGSSTATVQTGETIPVDLVFVEGDDFITMAFNALPGEEGNNPQIDMNVGDKLEFNIVSSGVSFHAFGVTKDTEGVGNIIPGTEVGSMSAPLRDGDSGSSEFIAGEEGTFYYICTVPGHRAQGMEGLIVVGPGDGGDAAGGGDDDGSSSTSRPTDQDHAKYQDSPTGVSHEFQLDFVESDDFRTFGFNGLEGDEGANPEIVVNAGDEITVSAINTGVSFHSFGVVYAIEDFNNVLWDSEIGSFTSPLKAGEDGTVTFLAGAPGKYHYICTVPGHALQGMQGVFIVE